MVQQIISMDALKETNSSTVILNAQHFEVIRLVKYNLFLSILLIILYLILICVLEIYLNCNNFLAGQKV